MSLIKSASGIRGTIGGRPGDALTPIDIVSLAAAFGAWCLQQHPAKIIVIGRDARPSGPMVSQLVSATLQGQGIEVVDVGLSTTPTVEMAVVELGASGGIVITASHNPEDWNALKLLNQAGEFLSPTDVATICHKADSGDVDFANVVGLGSERCYDDAIADHIEKILRLPLVDVDAIRRRQFRIAVDGVNSTGGVAVPQLLAALGVVHVTPVHCVPHGQFAHNPEPLPEHLSDLSRTIVDGNIDLGLAVDPDVDRLAVVDEHGVPWGEEYTLVVVADYVLGRTPGHTVSNLSSSQALQDVTLLHGGKHFSSPVGEQHVVVKMKSSGAVIGGEGNGGIIYPDLHYGRDALVGIALLLSYLARSGRSASELRASYPAYAMVKEKIALTASTDLDALLGEVQKMYSDFPLNTDDGVRVDFEEGWVHLRRSNTEPLIRIYAEGTTTDVAEGLIGRVRKGLGL